MNDQIIALLAAKNLLDAAAVEAVKDLLARGKTLEQALVGGRYVNDADFAKARAEALGLPFVDLSTWTPTTETMQLLPTETVDTHHVLPLGLDGDTLVVAPLDPQNLRASEALEFLTTGRKLKLRLVVAPGSQIRKFLKISSGVGDVQTALREVARKEAPGKKASDIESKNLQETIKGAPVARMLTTIMRDAVEQSASDIHIEAVGEESRVRYRIDGVLRTVLTVPASVHPALVARVKVLANMKLDETRVPQDGRITQTFGDRVVDFRISTLPVVDHEKVAMRILGTSAGAPTLEGLGFRPEHVATIKEEIKKPFGLVLITGPTGSGKSTTLFACLNLLNEEGINISTLEDPVEYHIAGVNQSQVRPEIGYTFASGLRSIIRQDPNVIMVGEIRDKETAELSIHAALTGHLMFSTLHTNDAFGIVPRLRDIGVEPFLLSATLNMGVAQRLARRICPHCKEPEPVDAKTVAEVMEELSRLPAAFLPTEAKKAPTFYHGKGCERCNQSGYLGRVVIAEVFQFNEHTRLLVQQGLTHDAFDAEVKRQKTLTLREDGLLKAVEGVTTLEEIFRLSQEASETEDAVETGVKK